MKSSFLIHSTSSLVMVILLLLSITDPTVLSSPSDHSLGAALKNESFELDLGTTIKPSSNFNEASPDSFVEINKIVGFTSSMIGVYEYFDSLFNAAITPKHTVDGVMKKMSAFSNINKEKSGSIWINLDMDEILSKFTGQQKYEYRQVEIKIYDAFTTMSEHNGIDLQRRWGSDNIKYIWADKVYDKLDMLMKGMVGTIDITFYLPDILDAVHKHYGCENRNRQKKMDRLIAIVHVATAELAFYARAINDKAKFNGEERIKTLSKNYDLIRERIKSCTSMDKGVIENYINTILMVNQADSVKTADVSKLLYKRFEDIYQLARPDIVWVFYTAWNFKGVGGNKYAGEGQYVQSYNIVYNGNGNSGVTKNGGWTVIWVGHPLPAPAKWLDVRGWDLRDVVSSEKDNADDMIPHGKHGGHKLQYRNAYALQNRMTPSLFSGRVPIFSLILTNPPRAATIGTPLIGERMNIWQRRIDDIKWLFRVWPGMIWQTVIVDFILF